MRAPSSLRLWLLLLLACLVAGICWPSTKVYYEQWTDFVNITYTHGWLILAVCVYLVWRERAALAAAPAAPWPLAQVALALSMLLWLVLHWASTEDLEITLVPAIYWLAVAAVFGWPLARLMIFPVAFFGFALPSWAQLGGLLQAITVLAVRGMLALTGPHAVISGDVIHIPNGSFVIEEGCSGLHFMIVGLAVAALHGELRRDRPRARVVQLALMAGLAMLANWIRVYTVIEAGYLSDMRSYLVSVSHYWFGWGVFAVALVVFFGVCARIDPPVRAATSGPRGVGPAERSIPLAGLGLVVVILASLPGVSLLLRRAHPAPPLDVEPFLTLTAPWTALTPVGGSFWLPEVAGADDNDYLTVASPSGRTIEVFRSRFVDQSQGAELVGESTSLLGRHLSFRDSRRVDSALGPFIETEAADPTGARSVVWSRYRVGDHFFVVPLAEQLWYGVSALTGHPPSELLALRAECRGDCSEARELLQQLARNARLR